MLVNLEEPLAPVYQDTLYQAKQAKTESARNRVQVLPLSESALWWLGPSLPSLVLLGYNWLIFLLNWERRPGLRSSLQKES